MAGRRKKVEKQSRQRWMNGREEEKGKKVKGVQKNPEIQVKLFQLVPRIYVCV